MNIEQLKDLYVKKELSYDDEAKQIGLFYQSFISEALKKLGVPEENNKTLVCVEKSTFSENFSVGKLRNFRYAGNPDVELFNPLREERNIFSIEDSKYLYYTVFLLQTINNRAAGIPIVISIENTEGGYQVSFNKDFGQYLIFSPEYLEENKENYSYESYEHYLGEAVNHFINILESYIHEHSASDSFNTDLLGSIDYFIK